MKKAAAILTLASLLLLGSWAQASPNPGFLAMTCVGPFGMGFTTYEDEYGESRIEEMAGSFKLGFILGPRVLDGKLGAVYAVATPYLYSVDTASEYGTGLGLFLIGKPLFLGVEVPVFASGNDGVSETDYTVTFPDFDKFSVLFGTTATYQTRTLFGREKTGRIFWAFKVSHTDHGIGYYKYTSIGILIGGSL